QTAQMVLNKLANKGREPRAGGPPNYYPAANQTQLVNALQTIAGRIVSCSFQLNNAPADPNRVIVTANNQPVPHDPTHTNRWDYDMAGSVQFYGGWCQMIQSGSVTDVQADILCAPIAKPTGGEGAN